MAYHNFFSNTPDSIVFGLRSTWQRTLDTQLYRHNSSILVASASATWSQVHSRVSWPCHPPVPLLSRSIHFQRDRQAQMFPRWLRILPRVHLLLLWRPASKLVLHRCVRTPVSSPTRPPTLPTSRLPFHSTEFAKNIPVRRSSLDVFDVDGSRTLPTTHTTCTNPRTACETPLGVPTRLPSSSFPSFSQSTFRDIANSFFARYPNLHSSSVSSTPQRSGS